MKKKANKTKIKSKKPIQIKKRRITKVKCPICKGAGETLEILDSKYYHCFSCGTSGGVVEI